MGPYSMTERGRPATTVATCREIHALLLENGIPPGSKVPRPLWDELVGKAAEVSYAQARNITATGALHGLWQRQDSQGRMPGSIVLLATTEA